MWCDSPKLQLTARWAAELRGGRFWGNSVRKIEENEERGAWYHVYELQWRRVESFWSGHRFVSPMSWGSFLTFSTSHFPLFFSLLVLLFFTSGHTSVCVCVCVFLRRAASLLQVSASSGVIKVSAKHLVWSRIANWSSWRRCIHNSHSLFYCWKVQS